MDADATAEINRKMSAVLEDIYALARLKGNSHEKIVEAYAGRMCSAEEIEGAQREYEQNGPSERARQAFALHQQQTAGESSPACLARAA